MKLLEFDEKINLNEKKDIVNILNLLLIQFEKMFKSVQSQYIMSSEEIKKLHITKFKRFFRIYKTHCENIVQKRNLYNILKRSQGLSKNDTINIDLGEENAHLLDISKLDIPENVCIVKVTNIRHSLAIASCNLYDYPSKKLKLMRLAFVNQKLFYQF